MHSYVEILSNSIIGSPNVATALKRPFATRSVSSSISWSEADGEFRRAYDVVGDGIPAAGFGAEAFGDAGKSEKSEGDGEMKDRY